MVIAASARRTFGRDTRAFEGLAADRRLSDGRRTGDAAAEVVNEALSSRDGAA